MIFVHYSNCFPREYYPAQKLTRFLIIIQGTEMIGKTMNLNDRQDAQILRRKKLRKDVGPVGREKKSRWHVWSIVVCQNQRKSIQIKNNKNIYVLKKLRKYLYMYKKTQNSW